MNKHKDLPPASQAWANDVDALMEENKQLKEVVRRLCENAGLDYSNPKRGINDSRDIPSNGNPVGQKLSSLADVQTYDIADKQVLTWSQQDQKWLPIMPTSGGINWELATEDEHLFGEVDSDSDYYSTQVIGLKRPYPPGVTPATGGTGDSYGLVGTSTTSAFLHGAQRSGGGPTRAHGYVYAGPYYTKMAVVWLDDDETKAWEYWGQINVDRENLFFQTPIGTILQDGRTARDGSVLFKTNWFYVPQVNGVQNSTFNIRYPKRPVPADAAHPPTAGAMVYDMTLKIPLWWDGIDQWRDALGNTVAAPLY